MSVKAADEYVSENTPLAKYKLPYGTIIPRKLLPVINNSGCTPEPYNKDSPSEDWYPLCNTYYNHTEDVDFLNRVNNFLVDKPIFANLRAVDLPEEFQNSDPYTERDAQIKFLSQQPLCFLILGKPGIGENELGEKLAEHWNCIFINPQLLIEDEINLNTRAGQCIEFNLRCGRAIGVDVLLRLLRKRLETGSVQHRGFVIAGFPLIANDLYVEDPISSESAVFNVQEIFDELYDLTLEIGVPQQVIKNVSIASNVSTKIIDEDEEEEEEVDQELEEEELEGENVEVEGEEEQSIPTPQVVDHDIGSADTNLITHDIPCATYEEQINTIFSFCSEPLLIIYLSCPNNDVVSFRANNRFDLANAVMLNLQRHISDKVVITVFSQRPNEAEPFMVHPSSESFEIGDYNSILRLPRDFPCNVLTSLKKYRLDVIPHVERRALMHDPQYFLKLDARLGPHHLVEVVTTRLKVLPVNCVVVPRKLHSQEDAEVGAEDDLMPVDPNDLTFFDCVQMYRSEFTVSKMFKWSLSDWGLQCPVALCQGRNETGNKKCAVQFLNKMFFLADEEAMKLFCRNPRPFLLPPFPKPNCRMYVIGPKHSGKTAVANCLAYLLNGETICPLKLQEDYILKKCREYEDSVRKAATEEGLEIVMRERREDCDFREMVRLNEVRKWTRDVIQDLQSYVKSLENIRLLTDERITDTSFAIPTKLELNDQEKNILAENEANINRLKYKYEILNVNIDNEIVQGEIIREEYDFIKIMPESLTTPVVCNFDDILVDHPFVVDYVRSAMMEAVSDILHFEQELMREMLNQIISGIETKNVERGLPRGGWVIDGFPVSTEFISNLDPRFIADEVIVLRDTTDHSFLRERYHFKGRNDFSDYHGLFTETGKRDAAWRAPSDIATDSFKIRLVKRIVDEMLDTESMNPEQPPHDYEQEYFGKHPTRRQVNDYEDHLFSFDRECNEFVEYLKDNGVNVIDVNITNKEVHDVLVEVIKLMEAKYQQIATVMSHKDRLEELESFGSTGMAGEVPGEGGDYGSVDKFAANRRLGDTNIYCPVTYRDFNVLRYGKEQFAVSFQNKTYLFVSEEAMNRFVEEPIKFVLDRAPAKVPPQRICIVGSPGSGKTTISKMLAKQLGFVYADYDEFLKNLGHYEQYIDNNEDLSEEVIVEFIDKYWHREPGKVCGIIVDGFPRRSFEIEFMLLHGAVPDIIIELSCLEMEVYKRLLDKKIDNWIVQKENEVLSKMDRQRMIYEKWEQSRSSRLTNLIHSKRDERYLSKIAEKNENDDDADARSQISFDSFVDAADMDVIYKMLDTEFPEPVFDDVEEDLQLATARFESEIGSALQRESSVKEMVRANCENENMTWLVVDANVDVRGVYNQVMRVLDSIKFRNGSLLERCYDVRENEANHLLQCGYYFLSRFGRTCPVQLYEKYDYTQKYLPLNFTMSIYPIIHRNHIYYITGAKNRLKFLHDPLMYINHSNSRKELPLIPVRLAVVGPPKCGKSSLAERFQRAYGLKNISPGKAIRYVLRQLSHSQLAADIQHVLRNGWELTSEMVSKCILVNTTDGRAVTQGFVLDGFPNCIDDAKHLEEMGIMPHLIFAIDASVNDVFRCLASDKLPNSRTPEMPLFSRSFIRHRFQLYIKEKSVFWKWLDRNYQNLTKLKIRPSKWGVWNDACNLFCDVASEIKAYYAGAGLDRVLLLSYMLVTPLEFLERQSPQYRNYCPVCLHQKKLSCGGTPPDRTGLVQFRKYYYWICAKHMDTFRADPEDYLPPFRAATLPVHLPEKADLISVPENVFNKGFCCVCCKASYPKMSFVRGLLDYAVTYLSNTYLFDSMECIDAFLTSPHEYSNLVVAYTMPEYPFLKMNELPTLGLLEQHCSTQLIKAITLNGMKRPIVPGLSITQSALVHIGLHLKLNNQRTKADIRAEYKHALKKYTQRVKHFQTSLAYLKRYLNPFVHYEEPLPKMFPPKVLQRGIVTKEDFEVEKYASNDTVVMRRRTVEFAKIRELDLDFDF